MFREYYPLTQTENDEGNQTRRYAGHQVQPRQALALLGQRGWMHHPEEGVRKIFLRTRSRGAVAFSRRASPRLLKSRGLTLEGVFFTKLL